MSTPLPDDVRATLTTLLAPIALDDFVALHYERAPLHLRAAGRAPLLTRDVLLSTLRAQRTVPRGVMLFPEHFDGGAHTADALVADASRLDAYLADGHPLIWNAPRGRFPALDRVCEALALAFGAHAWVNVYDTGLAGTAFATHFDAHEVFALHCEGRKHWKLSRVRADRPLDDEAMRATNARWMTLRAEEAARDTLSAFEVSPGDVVYIPRGTFHDAMAVAGRSLHVTFGVAAWTGRDLCLALAERCLDDPSLRTYAPPPFADPDGARTVAWLHDALARIGEHLLDDALFEQLSATRRTPPGVTR